jgi:uncharacterized protein
LVVDTLRELEVFMLQAGKALKVSIYVSDGSRHGGAATEASIVDYLFNHGVSGASVFKGVAGFGVDHHMHSASFVELSDKLPVKIELIVKPAGALKAAAEAGKS